MELTNERFGSALIIKVQAERIDAGSAVKFKDQLRKAVGVFEGRVILDLSDVEFIDSSGLGAVVACFKLIKQTGEMELANLSSTVQKLFELTRMNQVMKIHPSIRDALDAA